MFRKSSKSSAKLLLGQQYVRHPLPNEARARYKRYCMQFRNERLTQVCQSSDYIRSAFSQLPRLKEGMLCLGRRTSFNE